MCGSADGSGLAAEVPRLASEEPHSDQGLHVLLCKLCAAQESGLLFTQPHRLQVQPCSGQVHSMALDGFFAFQVADASALSIRSHGPWATRRPRWRTLSLQMQRSPRKQRTEAQPSGEKKLKAAAPTFRCTC